MIVSASTPDPKRRLLDFLHNLSSVIEKGTIQTEADLEKFVQVESKAQLDLREALGYTKTEVNSTLLEILGYGHNDVEDHPQKKAIVGQIRYSPDYILKRKGKSLAVIDLKSPDVNIDHDKWMGQIHNYYRDEAVPIGILFNGCGLRVFINTEHKGLTRYHGIFAGQSVASADISEPKQMAEILLKFSAALETNPLVTARALANKRKEDIGKREWQKSVVERLRTVLADPTEEVLHALAAVNIWSDIEPKPSEQELTAIWANRPSPVEKSKTGKGAKATITKIAD